MCFDLFLFFFFKQKTAYELRISDWSSDVCSSDLGRLARSMSRAGFDTDEVRLTPDLGMLQGGGIFEAVTGYDPVIRIRRDHHDRGIIQSAPDIVIRRIDRKSVV